MWRARRVVTAPERSYQCFDDVTQTETAGSAENGLADFDPGYITEPFKTLAASFPGDASDEYPQATSGPRGARSFTGVVWTAARESYRGSLQVFLPDRLARLSLFMVRSTAELNRVLSKYFCRREHSLLYRR